MQDISCDQEPAVVRAVSSGQWDQDLQAHAESCPSCRDAVLFTRLFRPFAAAAAPQLPSANYVWWQSRLRQRQVDLRRVTRLFAITRATMASISVAGTVGWIIWHWTEAVEEIKGSLDPISRWSTSGLASYAPALVYVSVGLLCINVLLTIRAMVSDRKSK